MSQRGRAGLAALALGVQLAVLYAPRAPAMDTGGIPVDKLVHVAVFALPTVALIGAGVPRGWVIGLMALHAPLSEVIQGALLTDRSAEGADVVADLAGVALGVLVASRLHRPGDVLVDPVD
jgi:VanZ family protein